MDLLEKYLKGDTLQVYEEIEHMGPVAFERGNFQEVNAVLAETMKRVAHNLDVIHAALKAENYCFKKNPRHDFEYPILKPRWGAKLRVYRLEKAVRAFGHVPLSFKMFYRMVGACNFTWDYETIEEIPWEGADPIEIIPITDLLREVKGIEPDDEEAGLPVAGDYLHKDNISGGPMYAVELTQNPQIDSKFLYEGNETTFINYLRIAMDNCGFSRARAVSHLPSYIEYLGKVKPKIKPI